LINQTTNATAAYDDINWKGKWAYQSTADKKIDAEVLADKKIDADIEKEVTYMQEGPAELKGAPAAPAASTGGYTNPYWNVTQDTMKPYRYRESYGTMNDIYDTWNTQVKYLKKNNMAQRDVDVAQPAPKYIPYDQVE
jgi:hypothetical protein